MTLTHHSQVDIMSYAWKLISDVSTTEADFGFGNTVYGPSGVARGGGAKGARAPGAIILGRKFTAFGAQIRKIVTTSIFELSIEL